MLLSSLGYRMVCKFVIALIFSWFQKSNQAQSNFFSNFAVHMVFWMSKPSENMCCYTVFNIADRLNNQALNLRLAEAIKNPAGFVGGSSLPKFNFC